ncbi:hypothetical protein [Methanothermococcus sp.]|uniref:hypothetical protein n=1 Tax=Methanothermococcus sp. TaxID=2614238 RepID=UPI0025E4E65D|nr:hypothetical protein [Methanothermococcus sp.]
MAVPSSKDIIILILLSIILLLGGYVAFDKFHTTNNDQNINLNNLNYNNSNTSINSYSSYNGEELTPPNNSITTYSMEYNNTATNSNNSNISYYYVNYSKNVPLDKLFMDLPYSNVIDISEGYKEGKIKTYIKNGIKINFDVRNYKPNLDNPEYIKVSKTELHFKYGDYYKYTYTSEYANSTAVSYCYYRKIGNYHITMGFSEVNKDTTNMWLKWNEYIYNLYKN